MKICRNCGEKMIENVEVVGQHLYDNDMDATSKVYLDIEQDSELTELKAIVCKNCGMVEFSIDPTELEI